MSISTYDEISLTKKQWFKRNNKLIIVRQGKEHSGEIIGSFEDDYTALEFLEKRMEWEEKYLANLGMPWMYFDRNKQKHKVIKFASFRNKYGTLDSESNFWFDIVNDHCLLEF